MVVPLSAIDIVSELTIFVDRKSDHVASQRDIYIRTQSQV